MKCSTTQCTHYEQVIEEIASELIVGNSIIVANITYKKTDVVAEMYEQEETEELIARLIFSDLAVQERLDEIKQQTVYEMAKKLATKHLNAA